MLQNKRVYGVFWNKSSSPYFNKNGKLYFRAIAIIICRGIFSCVNYSTLFMINKKSIEAGISVAVISSIISYSTFLSALLFYFLYKERLSFHHIIGMLLMILCVVFISFSKENSSNEHFTEN